MKSAYICILMLFSSIVYCQTYNSVDTTFTFKYLQLQNIKNNIELCKLNRSRLEEEVLLLTDIKYTQDIKIKKLEVRDSLYNREIELYKEMDNVLREKMYKATEIIRNQNILILTNDEKLVKEKSKLKKETAWKNIYKFGYPILGIVAGVLLIK